MKYCTQCKQYLEEKFFGSNKFRKDHLTRICRNCINKYVKNKKIRTIQQENSEDIANMVFNKVFGGYNIYILNTTRPGECKYNIISTDGMYFMSNDRKEFYKTMEELGI